MQDIDAQLDNWFLTHKDRPSFHEILIMDESLMKSWALAAYWHSFQANRVDGKNYFGHVVRVTEAVYNSFQNYDSDVTCAAAMHDLIEDHRDKISIEDVYKITDRRVVDIVIGLTNDFNSEKELKELGREERIRVYWKHVLEMIRKNIDVFHVKLYDFIDNASGVNKIKTYNAKVTEIRDYLERKYYPLASKFLAYFIMVRDEMNINEEEKKRIGDILIEISGRNESNNYRRMK